MIKKDILSTQNTDGVISISQMRRRNSMQRLSYLTDVMYDTLKMCLVYLQTAPAPLP